ncbi:MAG: glutamate-1-semialdehyde 2,1-aminomutase [Candidatus Omnitrophota bacterium]
MAIQRSIKLFTQARKVLVGGVNSPVRSFMAVGGDPLVIRRGHGAKFFDVDNNSYIDYCLSWGALIVGHAHPNVVKAVRTAVLSGSSFGTTTKPEITLAQVIVRDVPSIEKIRFVNSGTEATMSAIRLARGFTRKNMIVKFDGCYHGHFDDLLIKAGSGVANLKSSSSLGITQNHIKETISLPFNDIQKATETIERFHKQVACVILEPVAGNMGVVRANKDFLKALRYLTKKYRIVLIFDEVMSGYRLSRGGVQCDTGIIPDLTCLGKIIGGGFPVGAYGGRNDIMNCLAPEGGVYQAGTFAGNPVVMSAGIATLEILTKSFYSRLNKISDEFSKKVNQYFKADQINASLSCYGSMLSIRFGRNGAENYSDAQNKSSSKLYRQLFRELLQAGIYWPPAELETFFISGAHTSKNLNDLLGAIKIFFSRINKDH